MKILLLLTLILTISCAEQKPIKEPNDWFFIEKSYPSNDINQRAYKEALLKAKGMQQIAQTQNQPDWIQVGPTNIGGRITDIEAHPNSPSTVYIGSASGGVFKTTNNATSFTPIFDSELSLSIGDIAIDPNDENTIYVGQGEPNAGGGSVCYAGFGVSKSIDGGNSWTNIGLPNSHYISKIVIDPQNSNNVYVAAMGSLFSTNPERGVYRSNDAGQTWQQVLAVNDSTGAIDLAINPNNPNTIYVAMWQRIRTPENRVYGGEGSGIYRSTDGGTTWNLLTNGLPQANANSGRIGLAISNSSPNIVYASYTDQTGFFDGFYKTTDGGNSWTQSSTTDLNNALSSFGWWFNRLWVDPTNSDKLFLSGLNLYTSDNGGNSWNITGSSMHVDHHAIYIFPNNPNKIFCGNDGGLYTSSNGGNSWFKLNGLPNNQFYNVEFDYLNPTKIYGGAQDNGTLQQVNGTSFQNIFGGDGFYVLVDRTNSNKVYCEYQYGNLQRSTDGGFSFQSATQGISNSDRKNWQTPVVFDPFDPNTLYYGSNKLYKSTNSAITWSPISPDLTQGPGSGSYIFGTITTIAVSPVNPDVIYVGCDDGTVQITTDGGSSWNEISAQLPTRWITRVMTDLYADSVAYVTLSGFRIDENLPHIFRTDDFGQTWNSISSNLPDAPINSVIVDSVDNEVLYVGTDVGPFYTTNLGESWHFLGEQIPTVPINEIKIHNPTRTLLVGTYGRSMFTLDVNELFLEDFSLLTPSENDTVFTDSDFNLTWESTSSPNGSIVSYTVVIDSTSNFADSLLVITTTDTFTTIQAGTFLTGNYCFSVKAENEEFFKEQGISQITNENFQCFLVDTGISLVENKNLRPRGFFLSQNYPNPFNPSTSINYELRITNYEKGKLVIFDVLGKKVKEFVLDKAKGSVVWNGTDEFGKQVGSGVYFYRLEAGNYSVRKRMTLLK